MKGFQGQRSKVKVIARPNASLRRRHSLHFGVVSRITCLS